MIQSHVIVTSPVDLTTFIAKNYLYSPIHVTFIARQLAFSNLIKQAGASDTGVCVEFRIELQLTNESYMNTHS